MATISPAEAALPTSASHTPYRAREAEAGSPSKSLLSGPSETAETLNSSCSLDRVRRAHAAPLVRRQTREGEEAAGFLKAVGDGPVLKPPLADEGFAARFDLFARRRVDHIFVVGADLNQPRWYTAPDGTPYVLGNSVIEGIVGNGTVAISSCMGCHVYASFGPDGQTDPNVAAMPPFNPAGNPIQGVLVDMIKAR
jgi:hypothetical protein